MSMRAKWGCFIFVALILGSMALDFRGTPSPEPLRVVFDLVFFAVMWAGLFFVGVIAFRVLRKLWRWSAELK
jgi:hypothetical protein